MTPTILDFNVPSCVAAKIKQNVMQSQVFVPANPAGLDSSVQNVSIPLFMCVQTGVCRCSCTYEFYLCNCQSHLKMSRGDCRVGQHMFGNLCVDLILNALCIAVADDILFCFSFLKNRTWHFM